MKPRATFIWGSVFAFLSVALGAFAAHGLKLEGYQAQVFETAVKYQFYHALALLLLGVGKISKPEMFCSRVPALFVVGILFFSGSLYALTFTGVKMWGAVTPIGGMCFLVGWFLQILKFAKSKE